MRALRDLRKDYETRGNWIVQVKVDPVMDPLRTDRSFKQLLKRMHLS